MEKFLELLSSVRYEARAYIKDNLPIDEAWTESQISTWLNKQPYAVRSLIRAAYGTEDGDDNAVRNLTNYARTGNDYAF